jgi:hypothetical protein
METTILQVHITYGGISYDTDFNELDLGDLSTDSDIKSAVANYLSQSVEKLQNFVIDRTDSALTIRPQAIFG